MEEVRSNYPDIGHARIQNEIISLMARNALITMNSWIDTHDFMSFFQEDTESSAVLNGIYKKQKCRPGVRTPSGARTSRTSHSPRRRDWL